MARKSLNYIMDAQKSNKQEEQRWSDQICLCPISSSTPTTTRRVLRGDLPATCPTRLTTETPSGPTCVRRAFNHTQTSVPPKTSAQVLFDEQLYFLKTSWNEVDGAHFRLGWSTGQSGLTTQVVNSLTPRNYDFFRECTHIPLEGPVLFAQTRQTQVQPHEEN